MKKLIAVALLISTALAGYALAQVYPPPIAPNVGTADLFADVVNGAPGPGTTYVKAAQISGVPGYQYVVPLTAFSLTYNAGQIYMILNPAGTLATGTVTTEANPGDGQRECILSTQTQTALTVTANTGQSIANAPTALTANTGACWTYVRAIATWERS
jgi:hypothetical protein